MDLSPRSGLCVIQVVFMCISSSHATFTLGHTWACIPPHFEDFEVFGRCLQSVDHGSSSASTSSLLPSRSGLCVIEVALECISSSHATFALGLTWACIPPHLEVFEFFCRCLDQKSKTAQTMAARAHPRDCRFPPEVVCVTPNSLWNAFRRLTRLLSSVSRGLASHLIWRF